jgi:tetratricopeptide (TPR) repeat protein
MVVPADVEINLQPVDGDALLLAARTAHDGKDWRTAARLWQQVILLRPDMETAWVSSVLSLREQQRFLEAETVLATALERFPRNKQLLAAHGWNAADLRNRDAAEQRFRVFRELYPDDTGGLIGLHNILLAKGKLAELEMIVSAAAARLPDNREVGLLHASVAGRSGKWAEAAERYQALRPKYPHERAIYISLAEALRHLDRYDEAEQILAEGARRMPDSPQIAIAHAGLPGHERKWEESLRRFDDVLKRFPDEPDAYLGMSLVLKNAGLKTLRACFLHDAAARFPEHVNIQADQYWLWMNPHGWQRARARLEHLTQTHPNVGRYISDFGFALLSSGDPEKAERVLLDGLVRFPGDLSMRMNLARAAAARSAWREAAALWEELNQIRPDNKQIQTELGLARYNLSLLEQESEAAGLPAPAAINASEPVKLVTRFESLGEDCEFGLFQREVGAEPLGLLRFAGTPPEHLISALECRLEGVGTKEHTVLLERGNEYVASDTRFGMTMHTHINPATAEFNATYEMILKKLNYLKRQFLEDLEDGEKIFVYKDRWDRMVPRLRQFRRALSMYGPCKVLIVRLASGGWASGDIEVVDDLTIFGYIDRHGHDGVRWNVPVEGWLSLCRKAAEHWQIST